jgi:hypothetical protein
MVPSDFEWSRTEGEGLLALTRQVGDRATEATMADRRWAGRTP